ncbi:MAG TPA: hypothetical protein VF877_01670 [Gaiellaceae bacterium]
MSVLAVSDTFLAEPVSPELILVSPPEIARVARAQLRDLPRPPIQAPPRAARGTNGRALELLAVYLFCLFITLGPLVFALVTIRSGAPS